MSIKSWFCRYECMVLCGRKTKNFNSTHIKEWQKFLYCKMTVATY
jgi:hypothetical protein